MVPPWAAQHHGVVGERGDGETHSFSKYQVRAVGRATERQQSTIQRCEEVSHAAVWVKCISSTEGNKGLGGNMFGV